MTQAQRECILNRVEMVNRNLMNCNSGADIHEVGNMRSSAQLILLELETGTEYEAVSKRLCRLEKKLVEFFKRKYSYLGQRSVSK